MSAVIVTHDDDYPDELPVLVLPDAEDAAARAVAMTGQVVRTGLTTCGDLIRTFATPEFAPKLLSQTNTQLRRMTADFVKRGISAEDIQVIETPITVDTTVGEGFVIAWVWSVTVMTAPGMGTARQIWRTVAHDPTSHLSGPTHHRHSERLPERVLTTSEQV